MLQKKQKKFKTENYNNLKKTKIQLKKKSVESENVFRKAMKFFEITVYQVNSEK